VAQPAQMLLRDRECVCAEGALPLLGQTCHSRLMTVAKKVVLFNHKGGVSKTTTTFNLGWKLAEQGKTVVMVDADPQCNLTGMVLGYKQASELEDFYRMQGESGATIRSGLMPAFEALPKSISPVDLVPIQARPGLNLLAGDLRLSEYENTLGIAQELSSAIQALKNLPGSLNYLIDVTAATVDADVVLIDVSPGLGPVNQNLVSTADFAIIPSAPDFFSVMAVDSLSRVLPKWIQWAREASALPVLREASYPFPAPNLKILGTIIQKFRPRAGQPAASFQNWIDELNTAVETKLVPPLESSNLLLNWDDYAQFGVARNLSLAQIAEFNSLIAKSQETLTPIYALSSAQLGAKGAVRENWEESRDNFNEQFEQLARTITGLMDAAEVNELAS
jgi:cellulose biosynthesis protein BcsQ